MAKEEQIAKVRQTKKHWYANKLVVILLLIFFFPIGLFLMWQYTDWAKKTKWIVTGIIAVLIAIGLISSYYAPPSITVTGAKANKISTDSAEYTITGDATSMKTLSKLTINGEPITVSTEGKFAHKVTLDEGDTVFTLVAVNENGETKEIITIHRATKAELEARAKAEKEKLEQKAKEEQAKKEARDADAKAKADKKAADEKAAQKKTNEEKKSTQTDKKDDSSDCNFWCQIFGGNTQEKTKETTTPTPKIGDTVTSDIFAFRVNAITCGEKTISWLYGGLVRYYSTAQGKFCRLNITVKNIGDYEDSIWPSDQYLYNSSGQRWSYDSAATSNAAHYLYGNPLNASINPGNSITGDIVYDIPADQMPVSAEVDGGILGKAKKILLQ